MLIKMKRFCAYHKAQLQGLEGLKLAAEKRFENALKHARADRTTEEDDAITMTFRELAFFRRKIMNAFYHRVYPIFDDNVGLDTCLRWWNLYAPYVRKQIVDRTNINSVWLSRLTKLSKI